MQTLKQSFLFGKSLDEFFIVVSTIKINESYQNIIKTGHFFSSYQKEFRDIKPIIKDENQALEEHNTIVKELEITRINYIVSKLKGG